jgi:hypothetical protein
LHVLAGGDNNADVAFTKSWHYGAPNPLTIANTASTFASDVDTMVDQLRQFAAGAVVCVLRRRVLVRSQRE